MKRGRHPPPCLPRGPGVVLWAWGDGRGEVRGVGAPHWFRLLDFRLPSSGFRLPTLPQPPPGMERGSCGASLEAPLGGGRDGANGAVQCGCFAMHRTVRAALLCCAVRVALARVQHYTVLMQSALLCGLMLLCCILFL